MDLLTLILALVAVGVNVIRATPAGSSNAKPPGLLSDARRQYNQPDANTTQNPRMTTAQTACSGKRKLLDTSYQLDEYLKTKKAARMSSGIRKKFSHTSLASTSASRTDMDDKQNKKRPISTLSQFDKSQITMRFDREDEMPTSASQRPLSAGREKVDRRILFDKIWKEQNLSTDMPPEELAEKVLSMRMYGAPPSSSTLTASHIVKEKGDKEYEERYMARMILLSARHTVEIRRISQNAYLSTLNLEERTKIAVDETIQKVRKQALRKQKALSALDSKPVAYRKEARASIEKVGKVLRDHLQGKQIDFHKASLEQLEGEARQLGIEGMDQRQFSKALYRYLQYHRGFKEEDMAAVKRVRKNQNKTASRRARKVNAEE